MFKAKVLGYLLVAELIKWRHTFGQQPSGLTARPYSGNQTHQGNTWTASGGCPPRVDGCHIDASILASKSKLRLTPGTAG